MENAEWQANAQCPLALVFSYPRFSVCMTAVTLRVLDGADRAWIGHPAGRTLILLRVAGRENDDAHAPVVRGIRPLLRHLASSPPARRRPVRPIYFAITIQ